jgi:hypothetical protein
LITAAEHKMLNDILSLDERVEKCELTVVASTVQAQNEISVFAVRLDPGGGNSPPTNVQQPRLLPSLISVNNV